MKYFKTDGIRDLGQELIFSLIPLKLGKIIGKRAKNVVIGMDTRITSNEIYDLVITGLITRGCDVTSLGIVSSSLVSYISKNEMFDYGIMITASHNPYIDNGIKVFSHNGEKLNEEEINTFEKELDEEINEEEIHHLGRVFDGKKYYYKYVDYLRNQIDISNEYRLLVDLDNGSLFQLFDLVFKGKVQYDVINNKPNGRNINANCGSENISSLLDRMTCDYDYGVTFDGDGDRIVIINNQKKIYKGDDLLYLFAKNKKLQKIVTTRMSNIGLKEQMEKENRRVYYSSIGDKNVLDVMKKENIMLGGESSGHIIFLDKNPTSDALLTLIEFLKLKNKDYHFNHYYEKTINISKQNKMYLYKSYLSFYEEINELLKNKGEIFIRESGTENVVRINIQAKTKKLFNLVIKRVKEYFAI
ncbi:MAG: hypothetical protein PUA56_04340 [Bacillales bacterium]|nr:hypothetical protein [Bacillales bacterium]